MAHGAARYRRDYGRPGRIEMPGGPMTKAGKRRKMQHDTTHAKHRRGRRKP